MAKLTSNVVVEGKWYGPDYPQNGEPPKDSVTNEAALAEESQKAGADLIDLRFTAADFGVEVGKTPHLGSDPAQGTEHSADLKAGATVDDAASPKRGRRSASDTKS